MAEEGNGRYAALVIVVLGVLCCALPFLLASGALAAATGRWWLAIGVLLLALAGWIWRRKARPR